MDKVLNQRHPPARKKKGQEAPLNPTHTVMKYDGPSSTIVGYGTPVACELFIESMKDNANKLGVELVGVYSILHHKVKNRRA